MNEDRSAVGTLTFLVLIVTIAIFIVMVLLFNSIRKTNETLEKISKNSLASSTSNTQDQTGLDSIIQDNEKNNDTQGRQEDESKEEEGEEREQENENNDENDQERENQDSSSNQESSQLQEKADLTAQKLVDAFKENEESANQKYKSNNYLVFGEVMEISQTDSDKVNILLDGGNQENTVACLSPISQSNTQESVEEKIKTSDKVIVEGRVDGLYEDEVELEDCRLKEY